MILARAHQFVLFIVRLVIGDQAIRPFWGADVQQQSWKVDVDQKVGKVALLWGVVVFIGVSRIMFQWMRLSQS
ncbi:MULTISPECIES: hypothetical protein [unclassified Pseudomonas]|uniref:hypothetical protein n=1 Tax=unclassified Pseudomonas TaxID=196821 RepID=UPI001357A57A|nr:MULTISPECIES: hypothetical protein [unclassified Pseudomonas]NWA86924.1 hypothetical protein [Pseudomonas sp. D2002]